MRSPAEIAYRARQETANIKLFLRPPRQAPQFDPLPLPSPESIAGRLHGTAFETQLVAIAEMILAGRIPVLGCELRPEKEIRWSRDYVHNRDSAPVYFRRIPYLNFDRAGDHKIIWELNRHQHLVALAQAALLTGRPDFLDETWRQLESWLDQNPVCRGINWASALEVAFRALSWMWIIHFSRGRMPQELSSRIGLALYHHGCYLDQNLSFYFSPNTHLQGEALALHALGLMFGVERWRARGAALMRELIGTHVHPDGGHFEQSSYYHLYSTDMFLLHAILEKPDDSYLDALRRMARYLWALAGSGELPMFGDDDGGRLFHPFGERRGFGRATLAACAAFLGDTPSHGDSADLDEIAVWWVGDQAIARAAAPRSSELFKVTGTATMIEREAEIVAPIRAFGRGPAGHSHAHALHFMLRSRGEDVLIDSGTYTYVSDPEWRNRFRGTAAHNTVTIDALDQADPAGPFRWSNPPEIEIVEWNASPWRLKARCRYRGICHERRWIFSEGALWIVDEISGQGRHRVDQLWHVPRLVEPEQLGLPAGIRLVLGHGQGVAIEEAWHSPVFGDKRTHPVIRSGNESELPCRLAAVFDFRGEGGILIVEKDRLALGSREVRL